MGFIVGVLSIAFAYYIWQKSNPSLRMEVVSSASVIDVKEDVGKLEVFYNGVNLRSNHQTLAVVTLKILNDGGAPIVKGAYDDAFPFGVEVTQGEITKAEVIAASNDYLTNMAKITTSLVAFSPRDPTNSAWNPPHDKITSRVTLNPVILDPGDFILLKLLILHNEQTNFDIKSIGKIAGVKEISFKALNVVEKPKSIWGNAVSGNIWIQAIRCGFYLVVSMAILFAIGFLIAWPMNNVEKRRQRNERYARQEKIALFKPQIPEYNWVMQNYIFRGWPFLSKIDDYLHNEKLLAADVCFSLSFDSDVKGLVDSQAVTIDTDKNIKVNPAFLQFFNRFSTFVEPQLDDKALVRRNKRNLVERYHLPEEIS